jgi:CheY-like chemotaxis protein
MKALLVTADATRGNLFSEGLTKAGFAVELAGSALYATSMLERSQPDVIVADLELPDLSGLDLHEIVRGDPSLMATGFILIAESKPDGMEVRRHDLVMPPSSNASDVALIAKRLVREIMEQLNLEVKASQEREPSIGGSLDDADLLNLVQWLAKSNSSGKLSINMDGAGSAIYFLNGRPTHAEYGGRIGEEAVIRLFGQAGSATSGSFSFEKFEADSLELQTKTIRKSLFQLLLDLATLESVTR